jgi:hypothetical protein
MTGSLANKLRGQRISEVDLIRESQQALLTVGVPHHERSRFIAEVATEVVRNPAPIFCQLQPKMVVHTSGAWIRAYQLVLAYLADYELQETEATVKLELTTLEQPLQGSTELVNELGDLDLEAGQDAFRDRVERYSKAGQQNAESEPEPPDVVNPVSDDVSDPVAPERDVPVESAKPEKQSTPKTSDASKPEKPSSTKSTESVKSSGRSPKAAPASADAAAEPAPEPAPKKRQKTSDVSPQASGTGRIRASPKSGTRRVKKSSAAGN